MLIVTLSTYYHHRSCWRVEYPPLLHTHTKPVWLKLKICSFRKGSWGLKVLAIPQPFQSNLSAWVFQILQALGICTLNLHEGWQKVMIKGDSISPPLRVKAMRMNVLASSLCEVEFLLVCPLNKGMVFWGISATHRFSSMLPIMLGT